jgi:hypothetical protein
MEISNRKLLPDDFAKVALTLTDAFSEDPLFGVVFKNRKELHSFMKFAASYFNANGEIHHTDDFTGVACWLHPGVQLMTVKEILLGKGQLRESLRFLFSISLKSLINLYQLSNYFDKGHLKEKHFYLFLLGVQSASQGKGIGKQIMNYSFSKFGPGNMFYIENSNVANLHFYEGLGFKLNSIGEFKGAKAFFMTRKEN